MHTDSSSGTDRFFFTLASSNVPPTHEVSETYCWTPSITKTRNDKEFRATAPEGVLFPLSRWERLRALPPTLTRQTWTLNPDCVLDDGRSIHADRVAAVTRPNSTDRKPNPIDGDTWFEAGQTPEAVTKIRALIAHGLKLTSNISSQLLPIVGTRRNAHSSLPEVLGSLSTAHRQRPYTQLK
jgi:hypothetical protein